MNMKGYRVYDPEKRKVTEIKHVKFDESVIGVNGTKLNFSDCSLLDHLGDVGISSDDDSIKTPEKKISILASRTVQKVGGGDSKEKGT